MFAFTSLKDAKETSKPAMKLRNETQQDGTTPKFKAQVVTFTSETTLHGIGRVTAKNSGVFRR